MHIDIHLDKLLDQMHSILEHNLGDWNAVSFLLSEIRKQEGRIVTSKSVHVQKVLDALSNGNSSQPKVGIIYSRY